MQTDYSEKYQELLALPPARNEADKKESTARKPRGIQHILCLICALVSIAVLLIAAVDKANDISSKGVSAYIATELLSLGENNSKSLTENIVVFTLSAKHMQWMKMGLVLNT